MGYSQPSKWPTVRFSGWATRGAGGFTPRLRQMKNRLKPVMACVKSPGICGLGGCSVTAPNFRTTPVADTGAAPPFQALFLRTGIVGNLTAGTVESNQNGRNSSVRRWVLEKTPLNLTPGRHSHRPAQFWTTPRCAVWMLVDRTLPRHCWPPRALSERRESRRWFIETETNKNGRLPFRSKANGHKTETEQPVRPVTGSPVTKASCPSRRLLLSGLPAAL